MLIKDTKAIVVLALLMASTLIGLSRVSLSGGGEDMEEVMAAPTKIRKRRQQGEPQRVLLATWVFGKEYVEQRRFQMFLKTAATCGFDLAIVGHPPPSFALPSNVRHINVTWDQLVDTILERVFGGKRHKIAPQKIQALRNTVPYKACDYRPLFGYLFPDAVEGYQWWGHVDNDGLLGNLTKFVSLEMLHQNDVIAGDGYHTWGPFTLYRNTRKMKKLFLSTNASLEQLFIDTQYQSFDEWGQESGNFNASMSGILEQYGVAKRIRHVKIGSDLQMWDTGECDPERPRRNPLLVNLDDPSKENCGECVYHSNNNIDGRILVRSRNDTEAFFCHYMGGKNRGQEESLADNDKFQKLLQADTFRVTYKHGFDFVSQERSISSPPPKNPTTIHKLTLARKPKRKRHPQDERVLLVTFVFRKLSMDQQRLFQMFLKTVATSGFDLAIVGDSPTPSYQLPSNVQHVSLTWNQLVDQILVKLFKGGTDVNNNNNKIQALLRNSEPNKIVFQPFFGYLFPEAIQDYEWWGHIGNNNNNHDIVLLGNLTKLFPPIYLKLHDIITTTTTSGGTSPFTLYRNKPKVMNQLFQKVLQQDDHANLEEKIFLHNAVDDEDGRGKTSTTDMMMTLDRTIRDHAMELKLRVGQREDKLWDLEECDREFLIKGNDPSKKLMDDPQKDNCGECVYQSNPTTNSKILTRSRDDTEVFLCHYQEKGKKNGVPEEIPPANDNQFQELLHGDKFRVTYKHGFDFVREEEDGKDSR